MCGTSCCLLLNEFIERSVDGWAALAGLRRGRCSQSLVVEHDLDRQRGRGKVGRHAVLEVHGEPRMGAKVRVPAAGPRHSGQIPATVDARIPALSGNQNHERRDSKIVSRLCTILFILFS
jgi:hypothetical protein